MASARIHEAIAKEINKEYKMNELLLRIGAVAPDCWRNVENNSGVKDKYLTHFWNFRIKDGQANDYTEFYLKYYNQLLNPFYFGYLIHLMTDQYWKTYIDSKYKAKENGIDGFRLKDGSFHDNENWFGYFEDIKIQKLLAKKYSLDYFPTEAKDIPNFSCQIDELNLSGLFGTNGTLNYINQELSPDKNDQESLIYDLDDILESIHKTVNFIKQELKKLKTLKSNLDNKYKIAVDIDDTLLSTKELEEYYWSIFLKNNQNVDPNKEYKWGDPILVEFWSEYREQMAFRKIKDGAVECLNFLLQKGYSVDLLSARPLEKYASLKKKLVEYFENNNLHYNYMNLGFHSKIEFLKEHNYKLLIDNDLKHIEKANAAGLDTILFGAYNSSYSGYQTFNWNEIPSIIEKILENKKTNNI